MHGRTFAPLRISGRSSAADIESSHKIDAGSHYDIVNEHMLAEGVHRAISRIRMHPTAGPKDHTRHAIVGEMHRVGTWAANDRRLSRNSSRFLRRTERLYYRERLIDEHGRVTHINIE